MSALIAAERPVSSPKRPLLLRWRYARTRRIRPLLAAALVLGGIAVITIALTDKEHHAALPPTETQLKDNLEQVKLLFDYTKFHITVYATLAGFLLTLSGSELAKRWELSRYHLVGAVVAIIIAGIAAGIVAASMHQCTSDISFWTSKTGPYGWRLLTIRGWTFVEHTFFWLSVGLVVVAFVLASPAKAPREYRITISAPVVEKE